MDLYIMPLILLAPFRVTFSYNSYTASKMITDYSWLELLTSENGENCASPYYSSISSRSELPSALLFYSALFDLRLVIFCVF